MVNKKLKALDWVQAGFRALTEGGPQAIKIETIAKGLKVSKGSFYWHFQNLQTLKLAMLDHWKEAATQSVIDELEKGGLQPREQLRHLIRMAVEGGRENYGGILTEAAVRDWGRYNEHAAQAVLAIDRQRLGYLEALFVKCGTPHSRVKQYANIAYGALIGLELLSSQELADLTDDLNALMEMLLNSGREPGN